VIVADVDEATAVVLIVNVVDVAPAATVTLDGRVALVLLDARPMTMPPVGAAEPKVTVPVEDVPPTTEVGDTDTPVKTVGVIVRLAVAELLPTDAVIVAEVDVATAVVAIVKVAVFEPADTVTLLGVVALLLLEDRFTDSPPVGAAPLRVTVPVEGDPPTTEVGFNVTLAGIGGVTVRTAVTDTEP
jgi:hypothetical protein